MSLAMARLMAAPAVVDECGGEKGDGAVGLSSRTARGARTWVHAIGPLLSVGERVCDQMQSRCIRVCDVIMFACWKCAQGKQNASYVAGSSGVGDV
jgi:hypothetical protein